VCGDDGKTYFSACHAGCSNVTVEDGKVTGVSTNKHLLDQKTAILGTFKYKFKLKIIFVYCYVNISLNVLFW
jgi:hypothetical protein